eukprot:183282-Chlamydomonas_euryale.AAC.1
MTVMLSREPRSMAALVSTVAATRQAPWRLVPRMVQRAMQRMHSADASVTVNTSHRPSVATISTCAREGAQRRGEHCNMNTAPPPAQQHKANDHRNHQSDFLQKQRPTLVSLAWVTE